jgi:sporulation protein YlmC with PRC-barrel domain
VLLLTDMLGADVRSAAGRVVGQLVDLTVEIGEEHPAVLRLGIGRGRRIASFVEWGTVATFERDDIQLIGPQLKPVEGQDQALRPSELLLRRDVLDTQIVDVAGTRLARVAEVLLARDDNIIRIMAVEVGAAGVWRRLGVRRFADRLPEQAVDWADLHLTSTRGHALQLATEGAAVHRLDGAELAALVAHLPIAKAAEVLDVVAIESAAHALSASHPRVGARLLRAVSRKRAAAIVERMPSDDAASLLRGVDPDDLEPVLSQVGTDRAATLRALLARRANTEGRAAPTAEPTGRFGPIRRRGGRLRSRRRKVR